jgi:hypothetical protein
MPAFRPTPFDLVFEPAARSSFPAIREVIEERSQDPRDRDAFLMLRDVVALLHELRPAEGLGGEIDQLAALVHHGYLFWDGGRETLDLTSEQLSGLLRSQSERVPSALEISPCYIRMPEHRVWAEVVPEKPPEPLDGCFVHSLPGASGIRVLGVFGIYPERGGFSVVEATGVRPVALARSDHSPLFAPTLPGGAAADLFSLVGEEELLELGARSSELRAASLEGNSKLLAPSP